MVRSNKLSPSVKQLGKGLTQQKARIEATSQGVKSAEIAYEGMVQEEICSDLKL